MKTKILLICMAMLMPIATYAWIPFVEQGKVWSYNMEAFSWSWQEISGSYILELKIEGIAQFYDKEYVKCYAYLNGELFPDSNTPILYLREDSRTSIVYAMNNSNFPYYDFPWELFHSWEPIYGSSLNQENKDGEIAVYSAFDPLLSDTWIPRKFYDSFDKFEMERRVTESSTGRQINVWECEDPYDTYTLYEGVGYVKKSGTIFSYIEGAPTNGSYLSIMLFQVTRPDGEILYFDEDNKPTVSVAEITGDENPAAEYYNLQGMPATKDSKGVVIVKQGSQSHKTLNVNR